MGRYNVTDPTTSAELQTLISRVAMYGNDGILLGYFEPNTQTPVEDHEPTPEELDASEQDSARFTLNEVWETIHRGERF